MQGNRYQKAVWLVKHGMKKEALSLFQGILRDDPADENAWVWLVECLDDPELRLKALETCTWINPKANRARAGLSALKHPLRAGDNALQPMISVTGGETRYVFEDPQPNVWVLPEDAQVFTVSPETISPDDVNRREAHVYDLLSYRSNFQPAPDPWKELEEAGDHMTSSPAQPFRRPSYSAFARRDLEAPTEKENLVSLTYMMLAVMIVSLLVMLLAITGGFAY